MFYHSVEMFLNHVSVLVVAECLFDVKAHQVERDALVQPTVGPFLGGDEAAVILLNKIKRVLFFKTER